MENWEKKSFTSLLGVNDSTFFFFSSFLLDVETSLQLVKKTAKKICLASKKKF